MYTRRTGISNQATRIPQDGLFYQAVYFFSGASGMVKAIVLRSSRVANSWSCILENLHGNAARIYRSTAAAILAANLPDVYLERAIVRPSHWSTEEREYLLVTNQNQRLKEYQIYIGAHDYGHNLAIYWYLVVSADLFAALASGDLNLFQQQDLHTHLTIIHRCL
jgi:hypothetical protein